MRNLGMHSVYTKDPVENDRGCPHLQNQLENNNNIEASFASARLINNVDLKL
jgi:hypothetical protein